MFAPWGQYDDTRLVNIGTNRWTIKPEIGVSQALGSWTAEGEAAVTFYTDNDDFYHGHTRSQDPLYVTTRVLAVDDRRVRLFHSLHRKRDDVLVASAEQVYVHVDTAAGKSAPMDAAVRARLGEVQAAQAG